MRMELAGSGIHVSLIEPGPITSRFTDNALAKSREYRSAKIRFMRGNIAGRCSGARQRPGSRHKLGPEAVMLC